MQIRPKIAEAYTELYKPHRNKIFWGGRDAAKSWAIADAILLLGIQRPLRFLCAREIQRSIKESVHSLLKQRIKTLGLSGHYEVLNTEIRGLNGTEIIYAGLWQNIENIKSIDSIDIVWVEEAATVSDESWRTLIPSIRKPGSEIWASFNPKLKTDPVYQRFVLNRPPNAYVKKVSYRDNPWISQESKDEMLHLRETDIDEYNHVYEGELKQFADGAIYAKQLKKARDDGRITQVPITPGVPVNTFWDLGRHDPTAIWFHQRVGLQDRFIDYHEARLVDLDYYIRVLKDKGYLYGTHYLPHDGETVVLGSGDRSRQQILEDGGVQPIEIVPRISNIMEGIEMTRQSFSSCWFDETKCERGLDALSNYQFVWDDTGETFRERPAHTWASNGSDAFRQFAQGYESDTQPVKLEFANEW